MAKFYSKSDLTFNSGYVVNHDGDVVALPLGVAEQINSLETFIQKMIYLSGQPEAAPMPNLEGFERTSIVGVPTIAAQTPTLDEMEERSRKVLEELRDREGASAVNRVLEKYADALNFLKEPRFVEGDKVVRIDTPVLGNVLELSCEEAVALVAKHSGLIEDDEE